MSCSQQKSGRSNSRYVVKNGSCRVANRTGTSSLQLQVPGPVLRGLFQVVYQTTSSRLNTIRGTTSRLILLHCRQSLSLDYIFELYHRLSLAALSRFRPPTSPNFQRQSCTCPAQRLSLDCQDAPRRANARRVDSCTRRQSCSHSARRICNG
jgi:hypothetical protein